MTKPMMLDLDPNCPSVECVLGDSELFYRVKIDASAVTIWTQLTVPLRIQPHFGSAMLLDPLIVRGPIRYGTTHGNPRVRGTVLSLEPPKRLSHTYAHAHLTDSESEVTWSLLDAGPLATLVELNHRAISPGSPTRELCALLWPITLEDLKSFIETDVARMGNDWPRPNPLLSSS
jgi:uncharacterized protein YndB with AHSA1/START domain